MNVFYQDSAENMRHTRLQSDVQNNKNSLNRQYHTFAVTYSTEQVEHYYW